ncbi:hypothetical protein QYE76_053508 [Lolium multiflorum]|uniref:Integrase zinc-binding domain-containing protein n=1 Tax=Lolium multiflorum TaxID=4521 RepID=A0AAD8WK54_LOLMU|nr:hypothetical protein QYE76_053508 [Lolium multiflorum]
MLVDSMDIDVPVFVVREAPSWVKPIKEFLINGTLPVDENESRRIQRRAKAYTFINGEVYKRSVTGVLQRCVEPEEGKEMLKEIHQGECGHHASSRALVAKVFRHGFYWPTALENAEDLVRKCNGCQRKRTPDDAEELLAKIGRNHDDWSTPEPTPTPIVKKRGMIKLNDEDMREAKKSLKEKGIKPEDVKNLPPIEDLCEITPPSSMIEDPLYPEGHPKRVEQDSQLIKTSAPSKKKKKKHKNVVESSETVNDPNSISIYDAETESGNEHEEDNDKNDTPDKEEIEKEPEKLLKIKSTLKKILLLRNMVMKENLGFKSKCLFLLRN